MAPFMRDMAAGQLSEETAMGRVYSAWRRAAGVRLLPLHDVPRALTRGEGGGDE
jgi:hypothetical protein